MREYVRGRRNFGKGNVMRKETSDAAAVTKPLPTMDEIFDALSTLSERGEKPTRRAAYELLAQR